MIHVEDRGPEDFVRLVTIDRPERRNALDHEALDALLAAVSGAVARHGAGHRTRVLVVAGAGGHFCAGADLTTVEDGEFVDLLHTVLRSLREAPFPTVAGVEGAALGAGTQLAVACDLRTATAAADFGIPAAKLGLMVDEWTVHRLAAFAGQGPARAMLLAARTYSGEEAFGFGLVQRLGGVDVALEWADSIARLAPLTIEGHKVGLNRTETLPAGGVPRPAGGSRPAGDDAYGDAFARAWASADLQEGLASFHDRRRPAFGGR
jgi:enoyl-CoA hydratase